MLAYSFNGITLPYVSKAPAPLASKIAGGATPGYPGSYTGAQRPNERKVSIAGTLINNTSYSSLQDDWSMLCAAHNTGVVAQLCIRDNWYLWAICNLIDPGAQGPNSYQYQATYTCSDPYFYYMTPVAVDLGTVGATFAVSGNVPAAPAITVNVTTSGGTVALTNTTTGEACVLLPGSPGSYVIDSRLRTVTLNGSDVTSDFSGEFLSLAVGNNTLTVATAALVVVPDVSLTYNARSL